MLEQVSTERMEVWRDLTHKLNSQIEAFPGDDLKLVMIKMNALTYVDLLRQCTTEVSRNYYKRSKELGYIQLVNTMDRNKFILV